MQQIKNAHSCVPVRDLHLLLWSLLIALGWLVPLRGTAQPDLTEEVRVKAAYLHKFPSFVEWPAGVLLPEGAPIVVGICGADAVLREFERIAKGRLVAGRPVQARRIESAKEIHGVHVLFIGRELGADASPWLKAAQKQPILTVGEHEQTNGLVVLNFVDRGGTIRFVASLPAADKAGLVLSSRLLAVADHVQGGSPSPRDRK
jgi:hypothetical protein